MRIITADNGVKFIERKQLKDLDFKILMGEKSASLIVIDRSKNLGNIEKGSGTSTKSMKSETSSNTFKRGGGTKTTQNGSPYNRSIDKESSFYSESSEVQSETYAQSTENNSHKNVTNNNYYSFELINIGYWQFGRHEHISTDRITKDALEELKKRIIKKISKFYDKKETINSIEITTDNYKEVINIKEKLNEENELNVSCEFYRVRDNIKKKVICPICGLRAETGNCHHIDEEGNYESRKWMKSALGYKYDNIMNYKKNNNKKSVKVKPKYAKYNDNMSKKEFIDINLEIGIKELEELKKMPKKEIEEKQLDAYLPTVERDLIV